MFGVALFPSLALSAQYSQTSEFLLDNGMKVVVREDHRAPTVAHMVWYKAGSIDEVNGKTGVAHVLEHMMFKGTKQLKPGEFSKKVAAVGGKDNAFTSKEYTAYFQQVGKEHLEKMMALEADRMINLQISKEEFDKEIQVVMEERRLRTEDQPDALMHEQLIAAAFANSSYRHPIVGWMDDLKNMTYEDAQEWYQKWYAPNNAVLVVVGDVNPQEVYGLAVRYFGPIKARQLPVRKPQNEIGQLGIKRITVKAVAKTPNIAMAWKVPRIVPDDLDSIEPYALDVLASILDGHDNARLNKAIVKRLRLADAISASYDALGRGPQLFSIGVIPANGQPFGKIEVTIKEVLRDIAEHGVTDAELNRVKAHLLASQIYKRDSVFGQAMEIGMNEMNGVYWKNVDRLIANLQKVRSSDVRQVAQKYLIDDNLTVAELLPQSADGKPKRQITSFGRHE
jgi:zinc protease